MTVDNSTVNNSAGGTLGLSSMDLSNNARIGFVINNARIAANTPIFNVTGAANVGANTIFKPIFQDFSNQAFTLRVLNAGSLNLGGPLSAMLDASSPYLYDIQLLRPTGLNALDLSLRVKTETELGLNDRQASAYDAVLDLMEENATVGAAVTSLPGANEFLRGWSDLLPAPDAAVMKVLSSNANAAFGASAHRLDLISDKPDAPGGAWAEEFGIYHDSDPTTAGLGLSGGGFGIAGGVDVLASSDRLLGAYAALESVELEESARTAAPLNVSHTSFGAYGGWKSGGLAVNAIAGVGFANFTSDRKVEFGGISDRVRGEWDGLTYNAAARATYTLPLGFLELKPYVAADYMGFNQDGYQETADTIADLGVVAEDAEAKLATASFGAALAANFGSDEAFSMRPVISAGYRSVLTWDNTAAPMRFSGGSTGTTFNLDPGVEPEDAIVAGLGLNIDSQFLNIHVGYDAEIADTYTTHYGSITLRMAFW
jgi:outer membrane autotransporter protein